MVLFSFWYYHYSMEAVYCCCCGCCLNLKFFILLFPFAIDHVCNWQLPFYYFKNGTLILLNNFSLIFFLVLDLSFNRLVWKVFFDQFVPVLIFSIQWKVMRRRLLAQDQLCSVVFAIIQFFLLMCDKQSI